MVRRRVNARGDGARGTTATWSAASSEHAPGRPAALASMQAESGSDNTTMLSADAGRMKFEDACEKIRASSAKHLQKATGAVSAAAGQAALSDDESDAEIEDEVKSAIIDKLFVDLTPGSTVPADSLDDCDARLRIRRSLDSDATVCLICIASIRRTQPIWSCDGCRVSFHIDCVASWARDCISQRALATANDTGGSSVNQNDGWNCPGCRRQYSAAGVPSRYTCYCGRLKDPPADPWLPPHSCGEPCHRPLQPSCGHRCLLRCHPGCCPPCAVTVRVSCHCGRGSVRTRRCCQKLWACSRRCGKLLDCGIHRCERDCHAGVCDTCDKTSVKTCNCGAQTQTRPCADPHFQCDKVCGALLSCGNHTCTRVCHAGDCGACPTSGRRRCPCGATLSHRLLSCTEPVLTCGDTCNKLLQCGWHRCCSRCHAGDCGRCFQVRVKKCRCGRREKEMVCDKQFVCDVKCKRLKNCGKHTCNRKCCEGACGQCELPCGRALSCGRHRCAMPCHTGPCYPCSRSVQLQCACGATRHTVPCGLRTKPQPPRCKLPCRVPPTCHHVTRAPHTCHAPPCPPCRQPCERVLSCGHACGRRCHDQVMMKTGGDGEKTAITPWQQAQRRTVFVSQPCPPCQMVLSVSCVGDHSVFQLVCGQSSSAQRSAISCELPCGRILACGRHSCSQQCHLVLDSVDQTSAGSNCDTCERPCELPRAAGCRHPCARGTCHAGPCAPCRQHRRVACHCRLGWVHVRCYQLSGVEQGDEGGGGSGGEHDQLMRRLLCCGNTCPKLLSCGHRCSSLCHGGECEAPVGGCQVRCRVSCACARRRAAVLPCSQGGQAGEGSLPCDDQCAHHARVKAVQCVSTPSPLLTEEKAELVPPPVTRRRHRRHHHSATNVATTGRWWPREWRRVVVAASMVALLVALLLVAVYG